MRYDHSTGYTSGWMFSPRIGLNVWDGGKNTAHVFYGRFYAAPLLEDVRQDCVVLQGCTGLPVYDLKPERDSYFEIGLDHQFNSQLSGSFNLFRKTSVNILDTTQLLDTPLFAVFNNAIGIDNGARDAPAGSDAQRQSLVVHVDVFGLVCRVRLGLDVLVSAQHQRAGRPLRRAALRPRITTRRSFRAPAYTWRFGNDRRWFATLQGNYGSGFPVAFESANANLRARLPAHTTFDLAAGRNLTPGRAGQDTGLGDPADRHEHPQPSVSD